MKKFENNFIVFVLVANLFAVVFYGGRYILTGSIESTHDNYAILVQSAAAEEAPAGVDKAIEAVETVVVAGDANKGKKISGKCKACHGFDQGGKHKVGPNLWAIVDHPIANQEGFSYSSAFKGKVGQITWNEENLDHFLTKPKKFIKGTKMSFPGIKDPQDRADLIAWMKEQG
tara:strand:- start:259056 stop:259574 length:519 start_codon:yes stop_codon:yes gene_type:complete